MGRVQPLSCHKARDGHRGRAHGMSINSCKRLKKQKMHTPGPGQQACEEANPVASCVRQSHSTLAGSHPGAESLQCCRGRVHCEGVLSHPRARAGRSFKKSFDSRLRVMSAGGLGVGGLPAPAGPAAAAVAGERLRGGPGPAGRHRRAQRPGLQGMPRIVPHHAVRRCC